jgi:hypothetical protein
MKSSRERNILIAVLSVAGLGLVVDRVVIGSDVTGPAQTSAGVSDGFAAVPVEDLIVTSTEFNKSTSGDTTPVVSFADRLRLITDKSGDADLSPRRDAFSPSPGWGATPSSVGGVPDNQALRAAETFQSKHVLEAVLVSGDNRYAVIGGQPISIGQTLDGYRLMTVHERSAVFEAQGVRVKLGIKADHPSS